MKPLVGAFNKDCRNKKYVVPDFHKNYADSTFQNFHHCQLHTYLYLNYMIFFSLIKVQVAASLLLESKMFYVPFLLNSTID